MRLEDRIKQIWKDRREVRIKNCFNMSDFRFLLNFRNKKTFQNWKVFLFVLIFKTKQIVGWYFKKLRKGNDIACFWLIDAFFPKIYCFLRNTNCVCKLLLWNVYFFSQFLYSWSYIHDYIVVENYFVCLDIVEKGKNLFLEQ